MRSGRECCKHAFNVFGKLNQRDARLEDTHLNAIEQHLSHTSTFKTNQVRLEESFRCLEPFTANLNIHSQKQRNRGISDDYDKV